MLLRTIIPFSLFALSSVVTTALDFDWKCKNSIDTCNNACFAIHCKGAADTLTYDKDGEDQNRIDSGCDAEPCKTTNYDQYGDSCDEYPFASAAEGGSGAILRCVALEDNLSRCKQIWPNDFLIYWSLVKVKGVSCRNIWKKSTLAISIKSL